MTILKHNYLLIIILSLAIFLLYILKLLPINIAGINQLKQEAIRSIYSLKGNVNSAGLEQISTEHYIIKYNSIDKSYSEMVAVSAESAYKAVSGLFGQEPREKVTITIYPDSQSLATSFGWDKNEKALGVYWAGAIRILSPRVWLTHSDKQEQFDQEGPMTHELAHLLVDEITYGNYNRWWTEGVAQFAEKKINQFEFIKPKNIKQPEFYSLQDMEKNFDKLDQSLVYWQSLKAIECIVNNYGEEKIYYILHSLGQGKSMIQAIETNLDIKYGDFETEYYQYLATAWSEV